jgi:Xaa-Pro aminopeptidase
MTRHTLRLRSLVLFFGLLTITTVAKAQSVPIDTLHAYGLYDADRLTPGFHAGRRAALLQKMHGHSVALFLAAPERTRANDVEYLYHQDPNFYYLTGHLESAAALLLSKDPITLSDGSQTHEVIFVQRRDPAQETWTGRRLGPQGANSVLGFAAAFKYDTLNAFLKPILEKTDTLFYTPSFENTITDPTTDSTVQIWATLKATLLNRYPKLYNTNIRREMAVLRMVKQPEELVLMRKSIAISNKAHNEIIAHAKPGWHEYEMQALGEYIFTKNGAEYTGYPCIVGSGENSTILHYESNRRQTVKGDFIEMDIGAEYHGYSADITRSFPISGKFTQEQRLIYDLVLEAQDSGIRVSMVDSDFRAPHRAAVNVITRGLFKLGIITDSADYKKYFMHGTSHYLGLDVHDAGLYGKLEAGNVITVEPGIYIKAGSPCDKKWWNIGCRIEDDILITPDGPEILSKASPRKAVDVEEMMGRD